MPVRKFRDVSEMPDTWHEPGSPELARAIRNTWEFAERTIQPRFPRGVHKHRSFEELVKCEEQWERSNFQAYQARQRRLREEKRSAAGKKPTGEVGERE